MPEHVTLVREPSATLPGTNNKSYINGADINGVPYCYDGAMLRLSYDSSSLPSGYNVSISVKETSSGDSLPVTDNGDYTFDFEMSTTDVTVTASLIPIVSYIDADGNEQSHACKPIVSSTGDVILGYSGQTNWYCISGDVTIDGKVNFNDSHSHVVVMDGAHLTVNGTEGNHAFRNLIGSITIYGQSEGSGTITISGYSGHNAISVGEELTINGGIVNCTGLFGISAGSNGSVTINRGSVTANGSYDGIRGKTITLGCATMADRITASSYDGTVIIADGQTLADGSALYTGTLNDDQKAHIAGKTLKRYMGAISYIDENGQEQICSNYTILSDDAITINGNSGSIGVNNQDTWYVAFGNYTFSGQDKLEFRGHIHLILCDGATFTVSCSYYGISASRLTIYGQSEGTGSIVASSTVANNAQGAIAFSNALTINGGNISTSSVSGLGITNSSTFGTLTINGGNVHASGASGGVSCDGNIILGWTRATDRIYVSSYSGYATISVKDGQAFSNGTEILSGTITDHSKLNDKTLVPATGAIAYIDADGSTKYCAEYTLIESSNSQVILGSSQNDEKWYVASGNVTIDGGLIIRDQSAHIILCDGAAFTVNCSSYNAVDCSHALTIYGQSGGTGTLSANTTRDSNDGLRADGNLTINGGNVSASSNNSRGIYAQDGDIIINGGNINVTGESTSTGMQALKMYTGGNVIINGGTVNAIDNKYGIVSSGGTITLSWTKPTDQITAKNYSGTVKIATGQALTDGTNTYNAGTLNNDQRAALAGKTLRPAPVGSDASASFTARSAILESGFYYWASFYHASWNYRLPEGAQAFIMKSDNVLYRIGDGSIIPAGCAAVIMAEASALTSVSEDSGTLTLTATTDAPVGVSDGLLEANILRGVSAPTSKYTLVSGSKQVFVLSANSSVLIFRIFSGSNVPAGKAFYVK